MTAAKRPWAGEGARAGGGAGAASCLAGFSRPEGLRRYRGAGWGGRAAGKQGTETRSYLPFCLPEFHFVDTQHVRVPNRTEPMHMTPRWAHVQPVQS